MRIPNCLALLVVFVARCGVAAPPGGPASPASKPAAPTTVASTQPTHCLTTASLITLHFKDAPAKTVFTEIARQAEIEFDVHPADFWESRRPILKTITLDCDAQPFWMVMKEACHQAGTYYRAVRPGAGMTLGRGRGFPLEAWGLVAGPCLIVPDELRVNARVPQDHPETASGELALSYAIYIEPNARLMRAQLRVKEAVDDRGESLLAGQDLAPPSTTKWNDAMWRGEVPLQYQPPRRGARLARFKAVLHLWLQSAAERFEMPYPFPQDMLGRDMNVAGRRFRLNSGAGWAQPSLSITALRDGMSEEEWSWYGKGLWRCDLFDAIGRPLIRQRGKRDTGTHEVTFRETFTCEKPMQPGSAVKFVWEIPKELKEIVVPLEFKDWALP